MRLTSIIVCSVLLAEFVVLSPSEGSAEGTGEGKYAVWVYKSEGGQWVKQPERTWNTDDAKAATNYVDQVKAVAGWTATTNAADLTPSAASTRIDTTSLPKKNPDQVRSNGTKPVVPIAAATDSTEAEQMLARLRGEFPHKTDAEIIQVLRSYTSADKSAGDGMKWFTDRLQRAMKQKEAVEGIGKFHIVDGIIGRRITVTPGINRIAYDFAIDDSRWPDPLDPTLDPLDAFPVKKISTATRPAPAQLRKLLGEDFFKTASGVNLSEIHTIDAGLDFLEGLPSLQSLDLFGTKVTPKGLEHLKHLTSLKWLRLGSTEVTDACLVNLEDLTSLGALDLAGNTLFDGLTDKGVEHLKKLTNLRSLDLSYNRVTDKGLLHLRGLVKLQLLDLGYTRITDNGLEHLKVLTNLRELSLQGTKVTAEGIKKLRQVLPKCRIYHPQ